ncbi:MAG: restriction endonuclease [Micavibrio aeruginosavorus]|uniref:Restriction endonuclease n=1 Tax=Micavibrio aeruginosavorus TaxID=349221 RepID=A0A2W5FG33_9BACT|nr:MAG: restriction endonuclease [Micavibrio aeruginosavorus]
MIDFKEITSGENWELFARDFFSQIDFIIDEDPSRGADGGKDLVISEQVSGKLHTKKFKWLVSCKHYAISGSAVGTGDEIDISDRLRRHKCDGFIGFYSTLASSELTNRLSTLKENGDIKDYNIFDGHKVAGYSYAYGLSKLAYKYFPVSYLKMRPVQQIVDHHIELKCEICGCDWTKEIIVTPNMGIIVYADKKDSDGNYFTDDVFISCKGECDDRLKRKLHNSGYIDLWQDIEDLCNPLLFLKDIFVYMNILHNQDKKFSETAHQKIKNIYIAVSQRVLREITEEDRKGYNVANSVDWLR